MSTLATAAVAASSSSSSYSYNTANAASDVHLARLRVEWREAYANFRAWVPRFSLPVGTLHPVTWCFYDWGRRAHAEPLVCLHDAACTSDAFFRQVLALVPHGYRVVAVELPSGYSNAEHFVEGLHLFLDALGSTSTVRRVHLYGAGLGGFLALKYAQRRPERVASLVLTQAYMDSRKMRVSVHSSSSSSGLRRRDQEADGGGGSSSATLPPATLVNWMPDFSLRKTLYELLPQGRVSREVALAEEFLRARVAAMQRDQLTTRMTLATRPAEVGSIRLPEERITFLTAVPALAAAAAATAAAGGRGGDVGAGGASGRRRPGADASNTAAHDKESEAVHNEDDEDEVDDPRRAVGFGTRRASRRRAEAGAGAARSPAFAPRGKPCREYALVECLTSFPRARRALLKDGASAYPYLSWHEEVSMHLLVHMRRNAAPAGTPPSMPIPLREQASQRIVSRPLPPEEASVDEAAKHKDGSHGGGTKTHSSVGRRRAVDAAVADNDGNDTDYIENEASLTDDEQDEDKGTHVDSAAWQDAIDSSDRNAAASPPATDIVESDSLAMSSSFFEPRASRAADRDAAASSEVATTNSDETTERRPGVVEDTAHHRDSVECSAEHHERDVDSQASLSELDDGRPSRTPEHHRDGGGSTVDAHSPQTQQALALPSNAAVNVSSFSSASSDEWAAYRAEDAHRLAAERAQQQQQQRRAKEDERLLEWMRPGI